MTPKTTSTTSITKILRRSCREATALIVAREDRALGWSDIVALKLHLLACKACPKFENQVLTLRAAMGQWRNYTGEQDVKR